MNAIKPSGYWKDLQHIDAALDKIIKKIGHFPTPKEIVTHFGASLFYGINNHAGGLPAVRQRRNIFSDRKPMKYWKNRKNAIVESYKVMRDLQINYFPGTRELENCGYYSLVNAIDHYHGGFMAFRRYLKAAAPRRGKWHDIDFVMKKTQEILEKHILTTLPSAITLKELGYADYVAGITAYHSGIRAIREKLGQKNLRRNDNVWRDLDFTLQQAVQTMSELGVDLLPSSTVLWHNGYSALGGAITKYHGGMTPFRIQLNKYRGASNSKEQLETLLAKYAGERDD